jgi:hypothetical protein
MIRAQQEIAESNEGDTPVKKNLIILALALLIALPIYGLAAEAAALPAADAQTTPLGGQFGRRNQTAAQQPAFIDENNDGICDLCGNVQGAGYVDADGDGVCDNCGNVQGTNAQAPGFIDADGNGVCDNLGTAQQYQGRMGSTRGLGRMQNTGCGRNRR